MQQHIAWALIGCRGFAHIIDVPDLCPQGFLAPGTDVTPIAPALQEIWQDSMGRSLADFNFRTVTSKFNDLVYQYPIRIPERYSLVIRCAYHISLPAFLIQFFARLASTMLFAECLLIAFGCETAHIVLDKNDLHVG